MILRYCAGSAKLIAVNRGDSDVLVHPEARRFRPLLAADAATLDEFPELNIPAMGFVAVDIPFKV